MHQLGNDRVCCRLLDRRVGVEDILDLLLGNAGDDVLADYGVHQCVGLGGEIV